MNPPVALGELLAGWVASLDPEAEIRYRQALCREADQRGYERGHADGYVEACTDIKAAEHAIYGVMAKHHEVSTARYRLYCQRCRDGSPRTSCPDCEYRTHETFSQARDGDFQGIAAVTP